MNIMKKVGIVSIFVLISFITVINTLGNKSNKNEIQKDKPVTVLEKEEIPSSDLIIDVEDSKKVKEEKEVILDITNSKNVREKSNVTTKTEMVDGKTVETKKQEKVITNVYLKEIKEPIKEEVNVVVGDVDVSVLSYDESKLPYYKYNMRGASKWDSLILKVAKKEGINPQLIKVIIACESSGVSRAVNTKNVNKTIDRGLAMVNSGWGYDSQRLLNDPEYNLTKACNIIKNKLAVCKRLGIEQNIFNLLHCYNGYVSAGRRYASKNIQLFDAFDKKIKTVLWEGN